jgi:DNA repair protein RecN (Recombination protein N)
MLTHISISNYTIVSALEMEFQKGMTVITGETGAGKSIMLDALGLCLGDRADPKAVRPQCERAEINASFDIAHIPAAQDWLQSRDLLQGNECLMRRVVTAEGRSRAYINGSASTLQDCGEFGALVIDIHSQHAHQSLLRKEVQRQLLDAFAGHQKLASQLEQTASDWLRTQRELTLLTSAQDEHNARAQLLAYQVEELDQLAVQDGELPELEDEQKALSNAEHILRSAHQALELCEDQEGGTRQALQFLQDDAHVNTSVSTARDLLDSAAIQLTEAKGEIQSYIDRVEIDPSRLEEVDQRLAAFFDIARKHKIKAHDIGERHASLAEELKGLASGGERLEQLATTMAELAIRYTKDAKKLGKQRTAAAKKLMKQVSEQLAGLAMSQCLFDIALTPRESNNPHPQGGEDIEFLISTNPGAPPQALGKIASGGELSRISLAIQVVTASAGTQSSLVFDEVDVGIGGAVAESVGGLLRALAEQAQVLCVTHLPQVAAQGHQHLLVSKTSDAESAQTKMEQLSSDDTVGEIARMLGGKKITEHVMAHAQERVESSK